MNTKKLDIREEAHLKRYQRRVRLVPLSSRCNPVKRPHPWPFHSCCVLGVSSFGQLINKVVYVYGPRGAPLFPTPRLSNTRIEYSGLRPKCSTWFAQEKEVLFRLEARQGNPLSKKKVRAPHDENYLLCPSPMLFVVQRMAL